MDDTNARHLGPSEAIVEGETLPNTVAPIGEESYSLDENEGTTFEDRFAVTPLYTTYHDHAQPGEYLCDPGTGEPAIMREDGSVISVSEVGRLNLHLSNFTNALSYLGMGKASIYSIIPNDDSEVMCYEASDTKTTEETPTGNEIIIPYSNYPNLMEDNTIISSDSTITSIVISLDISVVSPVADCTMMHLADIDPLVQVEYLIGDGSVTRYIQKTVSALKNTPIDVNDFSITITGIKFPEIIDKKYTCFVHSILVGY